MKKISLTCLLVLSAFFVHAQKGLSVGVHLMPQGTGIISSTDFDLGAALDVKSTFKMGFGLDLGYNFTDRVGLLTGIGYSAQGSNYVTAYEGLPDNEQINFSRRINYLRVPLLLKYNSDISKRTSFLLRVGPRFGFLSGGAAYIEQNTSNINTADDQSFEGDLTKVAYSDGTENNLINGLDIELALQLGLQINITERTQLSLLLHLGYSVLNMETEYAADLYKNTNPLVNAARPTSDNGRYALVFPSEGSESRSSANHAVVGLQVGFHYILPMD